MCRNDEADDVSFTLLICAFSEICTMNSKACNESFLLTYYFFFDNYWKKSLKLSTAKNTELP